MPLRRGVDTATVVLAASFVVLLVNSGSRFSMGLLLKPMADDLGWTRSTLSLAVTVFMVVSALALPFVGRLVDRFGARAVLIAGALVTGAGLVPLYALATPWQAMVFYGVVFAVGSAATSITPIGVVITRWFHARAGIANSVAISGMGVGQLVIITALASGLDDLGWRGAFLLLGLGNVAVLLPLVWAGIRPAPAPAPAAPAAAGAAPLAAGWASILRAPHLWLLLGVYAICGFQDFFVATHVVAFALDQGLDAAVAGNLLALMGLCGLVGVLAGGAHADRRGPAEPTAICFGLRAAIFALVLASQSAPAIATFALLYGATFWITAPLTVVFVRDGFGLDKLGTLTGVVTMVHHCAGGLGAYAGAALFDAEGTYASAFWMMLAVSAVAAVMTLGLRRRAR